MTAPRVHTAVVMDTSVSMRIVGDDDADAIARAFGWFEAVERTCSRFDPSSELSALSRRIGEAVPVSDVVFETVRFALALARETDGAFDPTVGHRLAARGFDREYRTGHRAPPIVADDRVSFRDVEIDDANRSITLHRPMLLDLGAVAKGFAIDMAVRELAAHTDFAIDAGGDLYLGGVNERGEPWTAGIRHPRADAGVIETISVSNAAVCTSGDYLRRTPQGHHIIDPRTGDSTITLASVTVIAPLAIVADGLATAAFVLGAEQGQALLARHGVQALFITPELERIRLT